MVTICLSNKWGVWMIFAGFFEFFSSTWNIIFTARIILVTSRFFAFVHRRIEHNPGSLKQPTVLIQRSIGNLCELCLCIKLHSCQRFWFLQASPAFWPFFSHWTSDLFSPSILPHFLNDWYPQTIFSIQILKKAFEGTWMYPKWQKHHLNKARICKNLQTKKPFPQAKFCKK